MPGIVDAFDLLTYSIADRWHTGLLNTLLAEGVPGKGLVKETSDECLVTIRFVWKTRWIKELELRCAGAAYTIETRIFPWNVSARMGANSREDKSAQILAGNRRRIYETEG